MEREPHDRSTADMIAGFRAGDETAVRAVITRYGGPIQTVARSMVSTPELTAEVVQQTFVKAWRAAASFDEQRELAPWLYSIARRTAIDVLRREARDRSSPVDPATTDAAVADPSTLSFERTWEIHEVRRALDALPPGERDVMRMSHLLGMSHDQIAAELGVPVGTVKSRSARAKQRLLTALGHLGDAANRAPDDDVEGGEQR